jgi:hypothetical protein
VSSEVAKPRSSPTLPGAAAAASAANAADAKAANALLEADTTPTDGTNRAHDAARPHSA